MKIAIINYNAGNLRSVCFALDRLGVESVVSKDPEFIAGADKVIFPGVGEASSAMKNLRESGLDKLICSLKQPVLGICLGMQLLCRYSEEGNAECLGIFQTDVRSFRSLDPNERPAKVPKTGWNTLADMEGPLFRSIGETPYLYFVHGYFAGICEHTAAKAHYGIHYSAALQHNNFYATQFHPEKSGECGQHILENFIKL